jgi:hypothetical protein
MTRLVAAVKPWGRANAWNATHRGALSVRLYIWHDVAVEEGVLSVYVSGLRKETR